MSVYPTCIKRENALLWGPSGQQRVRRKTNQGIEYTYFTNKNAALR